MSSLGAGAMQLSPPSLRPRWMKLRVKRSLALLALAACSRSQSGTVTFGAAGPWTQGYGKANRTGIELALEEIHASPAWSSHRHLEIVFADDSGDGAHASTVAKRFVDSLAIVAVVGHVN